MDLFPPKCALMCTHARTRARARAHTHTHMHQVLEVLRLYFHVGMIYGSMSIPVLVERTNPENASYL